MLLLLNISDALNSKYSLTHADMNTGLFQLHG